ncbi:autotransporter outer membrane beta-barrel domain-containing protein [Methylobacter psychrophilus]|uniref:autotransporter outer membrane beta-barrel domain-containing protein n=1 Tax=Methylobacter psychrophilus TaxID=96941 RepID=UPI0021D4F8A3|nr:autotransporter outer membrane beta-barrel domain-containing protein [Methylobacter psychrophilus]
MNKITKVQIRTLPTNQSVPLHLSALSIAVRLLCGASMGFALPTSASIVTCAAGSSSCTIQSGDSASAVNVAAGSSGFTFINNGTLDNGSPTASQQSSVSIIAPSADPASPVAGGNVIFTNYGTINSYAYTSLSTPVLPLPSVINLQSTGSDMTITDNGASGSASGDITVNQSGVVGTPSLQGVSQSALISAMAQGGGGGYIGSSNNQEITSGNGGNAGAVTITTVNTGNMAAYTLGGIIAQSSGGDAGFVMQNVDDNTTMATGGNGGNGGSVTINNSQQISVTGASSSQASIGLQAYSSGGAGGEMMVTDTNKWLTANPGKGGNGGVVSVTHSGALSVGGDVSSSVTGILAQSIGGTAGLLVIDKVSKEAAIGNIIVGGDAGKVAVTVVSGANISLLPGSSGNLGTGVGVIAQSIGGGLNSSDTVKVVGNSGDGNTVTVNNAGALNGFGDYGVGILAQSIGGGGGRMSLTNTGTGYSVANANGAGNEVNVLQAEGGSIVTTGADAPGIVAQSLGDGGGMFTTTASTVTNPSPLTLGSQGSNGNSAGKVSVDLGSSADGGSTVHTAGETSFGILAQSIASGGGSIGGDGAIGSVGSSGVTGGNGNAVAVTTTGNSNITTLGDGAISILAQSIAGGGGNGASGRGWSAKVGGAGGAGGSGGIVNVDVGTSAIDTNSTLVTSGDYAAAVLAQSIGGGGGNGGYAKTVGLFFSSAVGGTGGIGGTGGAVGVDNYGGIITSGAHSNAIVAQSIAGGGGNGGAASAHSEGVIWAISTTIGGEGGSGGAAGIVTVNDYNSISTSGLDAMGILAQSIAGGGGTGGAASSKAEAFASGDPEIPSIAISVALGGQGGGAGTGNIVTVNQTGGITTANDGALGILAQSIGGGGGNGGDSSASATAGSIGGSEDTPPDSVTLNFAYGQAGAGGDGGQGGAVSVNNTGTINTQGASASAIVVQSIGGGGGNGALGNSNTKNKTEAQNYSLTMALGGDAGTAAKGGAVSVNYGGILGTSGSTARGIVAQSIGGGGGLAAGGTTASDGGSSSKTSLSFSLGGKGGTGGDGAAVTVMPDSSNAAITTTGGYSDAILAQSIGGGGGAAGNADNTAKSSESALDSPDDSTSDSDSSEDTSTTFAMAMTLGGGGGGNGGAVTVGNNAAGADLITASTSGVWSHGIFAQSIGGGGGSSGVSSSKGETGSYTSVMTFGGGPSGSGDAVTVQGINSIRAFGYGSMGIIAQSIGGGGGAAIDGSDLSLSSKEIIIKASSQSESSGHGDAVLVDVGSGSISTSGSVGYGVLAQSIGAGGGLAGFGDGSSGSTIPKVFAVLGADDKAEGNGGAVTVNFGAGSKVSTTGTLAHAVIAQSIGGGGGVVAASGASTTNQSFNIEAAALGNSNGSSGNGSAVVVNNAGTISTSGDLAMGIVAQSIGGGGGLISGHYYDFINTSIGGTTDSNSLGNDGDSVYIHNISGSSITTTGAGAYGILAQSIGGGGGFIGDSGQGNWQGVFLDQYHLGTSQANIATYAATGNGGIVEVIVDAGSNITTTGANAHGIVAQSVGGGGGMVSLGNSSLIGSAAQYDATKTSKDYSSAGLPIIITVDGTVSATGAGAYGIFAQSIGSVNEMVEITINGKVYGNAAGVVIAGGDGVVGVSTLMINQGGVLAGGCTAVDNCNGNGYAFLQPTGNLAFTDIINQGTVIGSIDPPPNAVSFNNYGTYFSGSEVTNIDFNDYGTTYLGTQAGKITDLVMTGVNYNYNANTRMVVDADFVTGISDTLRLNNTTFNSVDSNPKPLTVHLNTNVMVPNKTITVLTHSADSSFNAVQPIQVENQSLISSYNVNQNNIGGVNNYSIATKANFSPNSVGLHANEQSLARYFQNTWDTGTPEQQAGLGNTFARLSNANANNYEQALSSMTSSLATAQAATTPMLVQSFMANMMSCPTFKGSGVSMGESTCVWNRVILGRMNYDDNKTLGYKRSNVSYQFGGQMELKEDWFLGGSVAYEENWLDGTTTSESANGSTLLLGLAMKHQSGPRMLSASVAGGNIWNNGSRLVNLPGTDTMNPLLMQAKSNNEIGFFDTKLRGSYEFAFTGWYLRPTMDLDMITTLLGGYQESGAGLYNLNVNSTTRTLFMATPLAEAGQRFDFPDTAGGLSVRTYGQLGMSVLSNDRWNTSASLEGVPSAGSFNVTAPMPQAFGKAAVGAEVFRKGGLEMKVQWNGDFSNNFLSQYGSVSVGCKF